MIRRRRAPRGEIRTTSIVIVGSLLALGCSEGGEGPANDAVVEGGASTPGRFLVVTDIHFNPFSDPELAPFLAEAPYERWAQLFDSASDGRMAQYGSDSNWELMRSALRAAGNAAPDHDYVLYAGDYLSHDFNSDYRMYVGGDSLGLKDFVVKTMRFVASELERHFPGKPIYGTLGNTDAICGDYMIAPESPMLAEIRDQWARLAQNRAAFEDFTTGGYYSLPHPTVPNHKLVVLSNIFWSTRYMNQCGSAGEDPGFRQLDWLDDQLSQARLEDQAVTLLMHVPLGINAYSASQGPTCTQSPTRFLKEEYAAPLQDLLLRHSELLRDGFAGHTHMDNFRLVFDGEGFPFLAARVTPAVSPIFGNNPAFAVVEYDRTNGHQTDYQTHYLSNLSEAGPGVLPVWREEYRFSSTYREPSFGPFEAASVTDKIMTDSTVRADFIEYYDASNPGSSPANAGNWPVFACAQIAITNGEFTQCTCDAR